MRAATASILVAGAARLGVSLDERAQERFAIYLALLERWNARINLTRIVAEEDVVAKHFLDSLAVAPIIGKASTLVDVGAGPGFPGVPLAIARAGLAVSLVEATHKKCAFLEALKRELALPLTVYAERYEHFATRGLTFDVAVSRAAFAPEAWIARGAPLVAGGGLLVAMLGRERPALHAPPGFSPSTLHDYTLPVEGERALAVLQRSKE
jgi:16S rRNA (guanine527-N7)-methyltransferase